MWSTNWQFETAPSFQTQMVLLFYNMLPDLNTTQYRELFYLIMNRILAMELAVHIDAPLLAQY